MRRYSLLLFCLSWAASAWAQPGTVRTLADDLPFSTGGLAWHPERGLYAADIGPAPAREGTTVYHISAQGQPTAFATGFLGASGNAFDAAGTLYQASLRRHMVSKIAPDGTVSVFADQTQGVIAPVGLAFDAAGNLYVANCGTNAIQRLTPAGASTVYAASPLFACPNGLTFDEAGQLYVANFQDGNVLRVDTSGNVDVLATLPGDNNGHLLYAHGRLYVVARGAHQLYTVSRAGEVALLAGTGERGNRDGAFAHAQFSFPNDLVLDHTGRYLYVNEVAPTTGTTNHPVRLRILDLHPSDDE